MSHEITSIDRQQGRTQAWHKLTQIVPDLTLAGSWLTQWDVKLAAMKEPDGSVSDYSRIVCTDNNSIKIGNPVAESYGLVTNKRFVDTVQDAISGISGATVETVGSVSGRGKVFVSVKLAELASFKAAGREHVAYLNFLNSHDQSAPFTVTASNTCVVCANTFAMALSTVGKQRSGVNAAWQASGAAGNVRIRMKHTKNVGDRLDNVPEIVDAFHGAQAEFRALMEALNAQPVKQDDAKAFFTGFLSAPDLPSDITRATKDNLKLSTRRGNQIDRLGELFTRGAGNRGETLADVFSAVTDYYSHESAGKVEAQRQFETSEFGTGLREKQRAAGILSAPEVYSATVQIGNAVLAAN